MPVVEVAFVLSGNRIPADHGYALYGALSRIVPTLHGHERQTAFPSLEECRDEAAVLPIRGRLIGQRLLEPLPDSRLVLRLPVERIPEILPLTGQILSLDGHGLLLGTPSVRAIRPAANLLSRLVLLKGRVDPEAFLASVRHHLGVRGLSGEPKLLRRTSPRSREGRCALDPSRSPFIRRTLRIKDRNMVGYAVVVEGLPEEASIRLQEKGLGGRRLMGCGVFVPLKD